MRGVWLAGISIAAATAIGSGMGCFLMNLQQKTYLRIMTLAAGVMLCAAVQGLLMPAAEATNGAFVSLGIGVGAVLLVQMNKAAATLLHIERESPQLNGLMFVLAMAIHHFPEGLAAGVSFGTGEVAETVSVCTAIALQNVPEAMMILPAMTQFGRKNAVMAACVSGSVEIVGLAVGYIAVQLTVTLLPLLLSVAAGAMLYVIFENMLSDAYENGGKQTAAGMLCGYCGMLMLTDVIVWLV